MHLKRRIRSRSTTIAVLGAILVLVIASAFIPQRGATALENIQKWQSGHTFLAQAVKFFGFDHLFSSPVFVGLSLFAIVSLVLTSWEQGRLAYKRTFDGPAPGKHEICIQGEPEQLFTFFIKHGYRKISADGVFRFVKGVSGYWGNFLFHLGMTIAAIASLLVALNYQRGVVTLYEKIIHPVVQGWDAAEQGLLAKPLPRHCDLRLESMQGVYSHTGAVQKMTSELTFRQSDVTEKLSVSINEIIRHNGVRVYQGADYGEIFLVEFTLADGAVQTATLKMPFPGDLQTPGYRDFDFPWLPYRLSTRYEADIDRLSMDSPNRLLTLRLMDGPKEMARVSLLPGEKGILAPYQVKLLGFGKWTTLVFVRTTGIAAIFAGFFLMIGGLAVQYAISPREVFLRSHPDGTTVNWQAMRFADFYKEEFANLVHQIKKGES